MQLRNANISTCLRSLVAILLLTVTTSAVAHPDVPVPVSERLPLDAAEPSTTEVVIVPPAVPATWEQFPLMLINVTVADVPEVADLVDIVSYYTTFAPFDLGVQSEADRESFRFELRVEPLLAAAEAADLRVTVTPALLGHPTALTHPDPVYRGDGLEQDGVLYVNPAAVPGCNDLTEAACISVPMHYGAITPEYLDYWAGKLPNFFQAVAAADPNDRVWGIYGSEEIRPWLDLEYAAQVRLRQAIDADPELAGRPLVAYSPHNRMPEHLAATLLAVPGVDGATSSLAFTSAPPSPRSFLPEWSLPGCQAIEPGCSVLSFEDYFPLAQEFALDAGGELMSLQDHLMRGSYLGLLLGGAGHTNRIASIHRMEAQLEAREHVRGAYLANGQSPPAPLAFHLPDMNLCSLFVADPSAAEARHDFWSGVHRGQGIFLYNYQSVVMAENGGFPAGLCPQPPTPQQVLTVWDEYRAGLLLIKSTLREFLVHGDRSYPLAFTDIDYQVTDVVAGTDYLIDQPIPGLDATFAMPDYPAVHGSSYRIGNTVFVIVTSSYDQEVRFTLPFESSICSAEVAQGVDTWLSFSGAELTDGIFGIDGRVYRVELAEGGVCP